MSPLDFIGRPDRAVYRTTEGERVNHLSFSAGVAQSVHGMTLADYCADFERRCRANSIACERLW